jgi:hypothetical protein
MRRLTRIQFLFAIAAAAMLAGCAGSGSSAIAPGPVSPAGTRHLASFYSCPATGSLKYVSDAFYNVVNTYVGNFAGQAPCGQIASTSLRFPNSLYVQPATHDLYVSNQGDHNVLVFHRGQTEPYNTYTDPTGQLPNDVTVAVDGTVLAANYTNLDQSEKGSISTWIAGPNGGTFVGNFPETHSYQGAYLAIKQNGTIYFDDVDRHILQGFVWSVSCPAGACGAQHRVPGVILKFPGGMTFDKSDDLLMIDSMLLTADTFELPNPSPSTFPITGFPIAMAMSKDDRHMYVINAYHHDAEEYSYPDGALIGTVNGQQDSILAGVAVDP